MTDFKLPNTQTGGSQTVSASSLSDAESQAQSAGTWSPAAGTYGADSSPSSNSSGSSSASDPQSAAALADQQLSALMQAASATNEQDFQQAVSEFNQNHQLAVQQFGLQQAQQNFQQAVTTAGLTGQYNGQQTQQAQQQAANITAQQAATAQAQAGLTGQFNGQQTQQAQLQAANLAAQQAGLTGFYNAPGSAQSPAPGTFVKDANSSSVGQVQANGSVVTFPNVAAYQAAGGKVNSDGSFPNLTTLPTQQFQSLVAGPPSQGTPTLAGAAQQAALSGDQANGMPTEATQQFNTTTATDMAKLAATLTGPGNYFQYLTSLNNGKNIMGALNSGSAPVPQSGAPVGNMGPPQSIQNLLTSLGIGQPAPAPTAQTGASGGTSNPGALPAAPAGGSATSGAPPSGQPAVAGSASTSTGSQPSSSTAGGVTIPGFESFGSLPNPNQINPVNWDSLGPAGQQFMSGAYQAAGFDPATLTQQINASRPAGQFANAAGGQSSAGPAGNTIAAPSTGAFG